MKKIGIFCKQKPNIDVKIVSELTQWLESRNYTVYLEPDTADLMSYDVDSEETFEIEQNVAHRLLAKDGGVTVIEMSTYHEDNDVYRVLVKQ